jgi:hypothetical protein
LFEQVLGTPSRPRRSLWVKSLVVSEYGPKLWFAPPPQVGTENAIVFVPLAYVTLSDKAIGVPQAKVFATEILNGVVFRPLPSISMSG